MPVDTRGTFPNSQRSALVDKALGCVKKLINKQLIFKIETSKPTLGDYVFKIKDVLEFQCRQVFSTGDDYLLY